MRTTCECTLKRLLTVEEKGRVEQLFWNNGRSRPDVPLLAQIGRFSKREGCPHQYRLDEETGYCSCQRFLEDWTIELGELAGIQDGRVL